METTLSTISVLSQHGGKSGQVGADMIGDDLPFGDGLTGLIEMATDGKVGNITMQCPAHLVDHSLVLGQGMFLFMDYLFDDGLHQPLDDDGVLPGSGVGVDDVRVIE